MNQAVSRALNLGFLNLKFEKKPKEKKQKNVNFLLQKKRKAKLMPSNVQKWADDLTKKHIKTPEGIAEYFRGIGVANRKQQGLYQILVSSKVSNGNLILSDRLTNQPLHMYVTMGNMKTRVLSNDRLYLNLLVKKQMTEFVKRGPEFDFFQCTRLNKVQICSLPFECSGKIERGYYQDFSDNFAAIGLSVLTDERREALLSFKLGNTFNFLIDGVAYSAQGDNNACLIVNASVNLNVAQLYGDMKIINTAGKVGLDVKTVDAKKLIKYIDCKLRPDSFCPAFIVSPVEFTFSFMATMDYDYNLLFNECLKNYVNAKQAKGNQMNLFTDVFPTNLMYWNTLSQAMDFIAVFALTGVNVISEDKKAYLKVYDEFVDLRYVLRAWTIIQTDLQNICVDFYHAFSSKIYYDKLMKLNDRIEAYLKSRGDLILDDSYDDMKAFFQQFGLTAKFINNQFATIATDLPVQMRRSLRILSSGRSEGVVELLRGVGKLIYALSLSTADMPERICFPVLFSPGGFLGYLLNDSEAKELAGFEGALEKSVGEFQKSLEKKRNEESEAVNYIGSVISDMPTYRQWLVRNLVKWYETNVKRVFPSKAKRQAITAVEAYVNGDGAEKFNKYLGEFAAKKVPREQVFVKDDNVWNILKGIDDKAQLMRASTFKKKADLNLKQAQINNQMNQINEEDEELIIDLKSQGAGQMNELIEPNQPNINMPLSEGMETEIDTSSAPKLGFSKVPNGSSFHELIKNYNSYTNRLTEDFVVNLKNWYYNLLVLGGFYNITDKDLSYIRQMNLPQFANAYPLSDNQIDVIVADNSYPVFNQISNSEQQLFPNKRLKYIPDYTDPKYIEERINEINSFGFIPRQ